MILGLFIHCDGCGFFTIADPLLYMVGFYAGIEFITITRCPVCGAFGLEH